MQIVFHFFSRLESFSQTYQNSPKSFFLLSVCGSPLRRDPTPRPTDPFTPPPPPFTVLLPPGEPSPRRVPTP
jgi:hypothetical protein